MSNDHGSIIIFDKQVLGQLGKTRFAENYVGQRRLRPSSRTVERALRMTKKRPNAANNDSTTTTTTTSTGILASTSTIPTFSPDNDRHQKVVYKMVGSDGKLRRMNTKEKKLAKLQLAVVDKKQANQEHSSMKKACKPGMQIDPFKDCSTPTPPLDPSQQQKVDNHLLPAKHYHQLEVNWSTIEQEVAELRGSKNGVPPVVLSPPMADQCLQRMEGQGLPHSCTRSIMLDLELSEIWSVALKKSMAEAEQVRDNEDLRPMAYKLTPEPWSRLRPKSIGNAASQSKDIAAQGFDCAFNKIVGEKHDEHQGQSWSLITIRPPEEASSFDSDSSIIFELLYKSSELHISCGAKFGCDYLLYDGPRDERHAFGGLRVIPSASPALPPGAEFTGDWSQYLPLPTAYDLASFVRCLNTAGKLAILGTVVRQNNLDGSIVYRVAMIDVALEKVLSAPTHTKRGRTRKRKTMGQNLSKT